MDRQTDSESMAKVMWQNYCHSMDLRGLTIESPVFLFIKSFEQSCTLTVGIGLQYLPTANSLCNFTVDE